MKTNKIIVVLMTGLLLTTSCEKEFLDLTPLDQQTEAIYFDNPNDFVHAANHLHTNVYDWMTPASESYNIYDWGTDIVYGRGHVEVSGTNAAPTYDGVWEQTYEWLRTVNQLIAKGEEYDNPGEIEEPVGQAHFFRAWHHFTLLKRYGGVPIAGEVTSIDSDIVWGPRNSRYDVVKQILDDLDVAIDKLENTTVVSTNNDGHVTLEAAKAFKARVCLFEGTWEKYVGDQTDGDGTSSGAGTSKPAGYPSVTEMLTMAKNLSKEIIDSEQFELWMGVEDVSGSGSVANPEMYDHHSYYYLFNLMGSESNPAGLDKSSNREAIFRSVFDYTNRRSGVMLTHYSPAAITRKLMDMYLCSDGLPVHLSSQFGGYVDMNAELENRDYRLLSVMVPALEYWWGWGQYSSGAQYDVDIYSLAPSIYQIIPNLRNAQSGMGGSKFRSESAMVNDGDESYDYYHIRLAEIYLIYAEATCELGDGQISDADLDYSINKVRARGGVAPLNAALIAQANGMGGQLTLLGEIRRERALELYGEGQRVSDLCRWGIAEEELSAQPVCGAYITYEGEDTYRRTMINPLDGEPVYVESAYAGKITQSDYSFSYPGLTPTKAGAIIQELPANRKFSLKNYLQPIPTDQIELNPELTQNPGW